MKTPPAIIKGQNMKHRELKQVAESLGLVFKGNTSGKVLQEMIDMRLAELNSPGPILFDEVGSVSEEVMNKAVSAAIEKGLPESAVLIIAGTPATKGVHPITGKPVA